jgi:hypothetical protein
MKSVITVTPIAIPGLVLTMCKSCAYVIGVMNTIPTLGPVEVTIAGINHASELKFLYHLCINISESQQNGSGSVALTAGSHIALAILIVPIRNLL